MRDEQSLLAVRDRILNEIKKKRRIGAATQEFKTAKEAMNRFINDLAKMHPMEKSDEVLTYLVKLRQVSPDDGRLSGECRVMVDNLIDMLSSE